MGAFSDRVRVIVYVQAIAFGSFGNRVSCVISFESHDRFQAVRCGAAHSHCTLIGNDQLERRYGHRHVVQDYRWSSRADCVRSINRVESFRSRHGGDGVGVTLDGEGGDSDCCNVSS